MGAMFGRGLRPITASVAGLVVAALALGACGGGSGGTSQAKRERSARAPSYGGEVVYGLEAETSGGFCLPESQLAISGMMVVRAVYDTLTVPTAEGTFAPYLAESVKPNADYTHWTIKLRGGIKFHDGSALDATVVKNNLDAYRGLYPGRNGLLFRFVLNNITSIDVVDDLTLTISTRVPWPALPAYLYGASRLGIMAQAQLDDPDHCDTNMIGTGPFEVDEWVVNDHLTASKNPHYWARDNKGNQLPYLDRIEFRPTPEPSTRVNALLSGQYNVIHDSVAESAETLQKAEASGDVNVTSTLHNAEVGFIMFNSAKAPFDDIVARRAVAEALDRNLFKRVIGLGRYKMATGPFPPGAPGYLKDSGFPGYDLVDAKKLVRQYEDSSGRSFKFTYVYPNDVLSTKSAQFLKEQLAMAGIDVRLRAVEQAVQINTVLGNDWEATPFRNLPGGVPDASYVWWYGGSPVNLGKFNDVKVNALLDTGRSELDPAKAETVYQDLNRRMSTQIYNLWFNWIQWEIATAPDVHGVYGPTLPDGSKPAQGLSTGHSVAGLWIER